MLRVFPVCCLLGWVTACSDPLVSAQEADESSSTQGVGETPLPSGDESTTRSDSSPASTTIPPSETGTDASSEGGDSSTGDTSVCGDGIIDGQETCDDGNAEDGDACRADCRLAFEILDMSQFHVGNDLVFEVAVDPRGTAWAAGVSATESGVDAIVLSVTPDGQIDPFWHSVTPGDDDFSSVALLPGGDIVTAGGFTEDGDRDGRLMRLTTPGQVSWIHDYDGPDDGDSVATRDYAHDVAVNGAGELLVAYSSREIGEGSDIRISKYDEAGGELWSWTYAGTAHDDDAPAKLVIAPDGDVVFGGYSQEAGEPRGGVLGRVSDDGELRALQTSLPDRVFALGVDADGVVAVGEGWIERRSRDLQDVVYTDLNPGFDYGFGVTPIAGGFVISGGVGVTGEQSNAFVGAWGNDGSPWWSDTYDNPEASLNDVARDSALAPDGSLVVVGTTLEIGASSNIFVRRYGLFD